MANATPKTVLDIMHNAQYFTPADGNIMEINGYKVKHTPATPMSCESVMVYAGHIDGVKAAWMKTKRGAKWDSRPAFVSAGDEF